MTRSGTAGHCPVLVGSPAVLGARRISAGILPANRSHDAPAGPTGPAPPAAPCDPAATLVGTRSRAGARAGGVGFSEGLGPLTPRRVLRPLLERRASAPTAPTAVFIGGSARGRPAPRRPRPAPHALVCTATPTGRRCALA